MSEIALIARSIFYLGYLVVKVVILFSVSPGDHCVISVYSELPLWHTLLINKFYIILTCDVA